MKECHILSKDFWTSIEIVKLFYCSFYLSLHHRDKSHMVLLYNSFNGLLNLACWYFVENFCNNTQSGYLIIVLSSCNVLIYLVSWSWWWPCRMTLEMFLPSSLISRIFCRTSINYSIIFHRIHQWSHQALGLLCVDRFLITNSISLLIKAVQIFSIFLIHSW